MIRLLTQQDYDIVQSYLDEDPLNNVYLIHGLQAHGLESKQVAFWGAFSHDRLEGVLLVNNDSRRRVGYLAGDNPEVLARLGKLAVKAGANTLVGKSTYVQPAVAAIENLHPQVEIQKRTEGHLWEIHPGQVVGYYDHPVRMATQDDIPLLVALDKDFEFASSRTEEEVEREIRRAIDESACFLIELDGRAVSAARIDPETDQAGVIESSRTLPEFRRRGMNSSVRTACTEYLSRKGKVTLGVTADTNIAVHKVVKKLGGSLTEPWLYVHFKRRPRLRRRILPPRLRRWASRIRRVKR
jgi:predicted GNAT family acetyltransferase